MSITLGILTSSSNVFPRLGKDLIAGIKTAFKAEGVSSPQIIVENLGVGGSDKNINDPAQKMALQNDPQAVIAFAGSFASPILEKVFNANEIPTIVTNLGGNYPFIEKSEYLFFNSLDLWHSALLQGAWAAKNGAKKLSLASCFYDSGYDISAAFIKGFTECGGEIAHWFTHQDLPDQAGFDAYQKFISEGEIDTIMAVLSQENGQLFLERAQKAQIQNKTALMSIGTMFLPQFLNGSQLEEGTINAISYAPSLPGKTNQEFVELIQSKTGKSPSLHHLLGWEAGLLLAKAIKETGLESPHPDAIKDALEKVKIQSPRGELIFDPNSRRTSPKHFLFQSHREGETWSQKFIEELETQAESTNWFKEEKASRENANQSGWFNPYLCL